MTSATPSPEMSARDTQVPYDSTWHMGTLRILACITGMDDTFPDSAWKELGCICAWYPAPQTLKRLFCVSTMHGLNWAGLITEGLPDLDQLVEEDAAQDERQQRLFRAAPEGHPALTPLTEETEADLRSTSYRTGPFSATLPTTHEQGAPCCLYSQRSPASLPLKHRPK